MPLISRDERPIYLSIADEFLPDLSAGWLEEALQHGLAQVLNPGQPAQVSLVIADDATLRQLNRDYRGLDEVTDVLSFSSSHQGHWEGEGEPPPGLGDEPPEGWPPFALPPDEPPPLGEIIISYPQARRQAEALGRSVDRELALLIVHGALHLAGHDHAEPEETARMQAREQAALAALFGPPTVAE